MSAKILQVDWLLSSKLLMYIKNKRGPIKEPSGAPDFFIFQEEILPLRETISFYSFYKLIY